MTLKIWYKHSDLKTWIPVLSWPQTQTIDLLFSWVKEQYGEDCDIRMEWVKI